MKKYIFKFKIQIISILFLFLISLGILFCFLELYHLDINIPLTYSGGDDFFALNTAKTVKDTGWIFENNNLGAPFGTKNYDYPSLLLDNFDAFVLKILVNITNSIAAAVNLQFILLFPLISIISYLVFRSLKVKNVLSILGGLTYAFSPYIFLRGMHHTVLSTYEFIPLSVLLCIWIFEDAKFYKISKDFFKYKKNYIAILFALLIANNGIAYYPFFTCFFLLITGFSKAINDKSMKAIYRSVALVFTITIILLLNLIPTFSYMLKEGTNTLAVSRSRIDAEIYGLKIIQLFLPVNAHGIGILNSVISQYNTNAPLVNENNCSYLGVVGILGFVALLFMLFYKKIDNSLKQVLKLLAELNISAILLATIGGFGSIICIFITSMIRCYNRISIFILFFSILAVCLLVTYIYNNTSHKKIILMAAIFIFSGSILEQFPGTVPAYTITKSSYNSDKAFIEKIENNVSEGAMIFQLPYHQYPESGTVNNMKDYQLLTGYLLSDNLKWSYGGMKGRQSDIWNSMISALDTVTMVKAISVAGFEGIYIDKRAYTDEEFNQLSNALTNIIKEPPIFSDNNNLAFFNMATFNKDYYSQYTDDELDKIKKQILNINTFSLGDGFSVIEGEKPNQWMWLSNDAKLIVNNYSNNDSEYNLKFKISSNYIDISNLKLYINNDLYKYQLNSDGVNINLNVVLKSGKNIISFKTDSKRVVAPNDPRELYLKITDFNFSSTFQLK
jgi:hypothetical protein